MLSMFESPASLQLSLVSWLSLTYYRDSKTANHANAGLFTVTWNKKPWRNQAGLRSTHTWTWATCTARRWAAAKVCRGERPLWPARTTTCMQATSLTQEPTEFHSWSKKRMEEPGAFFIPAEVAKYGTSSKAAADGKLLSSCCQPALPGRRNLPK